MFLEVVRTWGGNTEITVRNLCCSCSVAKSCLILGNFTTAALQVPLSFTISQSLFKFISTESVMLSNHLISIAPLSSCLQYFPASRSFPMSQLLASGGLSTGVSPSASVLPMNIQGGSPLGLSGFISAVQGTQVFSSTIPKHQSFGAQPSLWSNSHICT